MSTVRGHLWRALVLGCALAGSSAERSSAAPPVRHAGRGRRAPLHGRRLRAALPPAPTNAQSRYYAATALILGEWEARQARAFGVVVPAAAVDAALAEALRQAEIIGAEYAGDSSPEELRIGVENGIRRELILDAMLRNLPTGPEAFGRAFDSAAARQRAVTRCLAKYADPVLDLCGNRPKHPGGCVTMGLLDICEEIYPQSRAWHFYSDVWTDFYDPAIAFEEPDPNPGFKRLLRYIRAHAPAGRRCFWEADDSLFEFVCSTREEAIAVAYAITRVHQKAKQSWTVPATYGRL